MVLGTMGAHESENAAASEQNKAWAYRLLRIVVLFSGNFGITVELPRCNPNVSNAAVFCLRRVDHLVRDEGLHHRKPHGLETWVDRRRFKLRDGDAEHFCSPYRPVKRRPAQF